MNDGARDPFDDASDPYAAEAPRDGAPPKVTRRAVAGAAVLLPVLASIGCASVPRACVPRPHWTGSCRQKYCRYYRA